MLIAHGVAAKDAAWLLGVDGPAVGIFAYLGAKHMVTGYDHLLFLAGVIFFLYRLRDVFGLIHGFGLATKLQDFALPQNGLLVNMISFNIGVEIGQVLALSAMLLAFTFWRKHDSFRRWSFGANSLLMAAGFVLVGFQLGGYVAAADVHTITLPEESASPINGHEDAWMADEVRFTIAPGDFVEYKYRMDKTSPMLYSWKASATVEYDFHTEPENEESAESISFDFGAEASRTGSYIAPFDGMHGWYWKNVGDAPVTLSLTSQGFYRGPIEYKSDGTRVARTLRRVDGIASGSGR